MVYIPKIGRIIQATKHTKQRVSIPIKLVIQQPSEQRVIIHIKLVIQLLQVIPQLFKQLVRLAKQQLVVHIKRWVAKHIIQ